VEDRDGSHYKLGETARPRRNDSQRVPTVPGRPFRFMWVGRQPFYRTIGINLGAATVPGRR